MCKFKDESLQANYFLMVQSVKEYWFVYTFKSIPDRSKSLVATSIYTPTPMLCIVLFRGLLATNSQLKNFLFSL